MGSPRRSFFQQKIAQEAIDVDKDNDEIVRQRRRGSLSPAQEFARELARRGGPSDPSQLARLRELERQEAAQRAEERSEAARKTRLGDSSTPATADANRDNLVRNTTAFGGPGGSVPERQAGTARNPIGSSGRKRITDSAPPRIEPIPEFERNQTIPDNVLNDYINLQYHLVLSMLPSTEAVEVQRKIPLASSAQTNQTSKGFDELRNLLEAQNALPLASTGDVFQDDGSVELNVQDLVSLGQLPTAFDTGDENATLWRSTTGRNYYNIKSLNIENVTSPTTNNPYIASMTTAQMTLVEPHGFRLHEDIRNMADDLGYQEISPGRIVYRLDVFFSGYNQNTGEWVPFVPINIRNGSDNVKLITYYVNIASLEAQVEHTGTTYTLDLTPAGHIAWRPEEMTLEAGTTLTGGSGNAGETRQTFGGFLKILEDTLNTACRERTHGQIDREYEFIAPQQLSEASFFEGTFASQHGFLRQNRQGETVIAQGRDVDVLTIIEAALKDMEYSWDLFLKEQDQEHSIPRVHWSVRFNAIYEGGPHTGLYDFRKIKLQYIIEPFATFKRSTIEKREEAVLHLDTAAQLRRVEEMVRLGMINRIYNYIHTNLNTEVINFDISLKPFYFRALNTFAGNQSNIGEAERESAANQINKLGRKGVEGKVVKEAGQNPPPPRSEQTTTEQAVRSIFGGDSRPKAACLLGNEPSPWTVMGGGLHEMPVSDFSSAIASGDQDRRSKFEQQLDDHLKNDLITLNNFEVRGDPIWLLSPYANHSGSVLATQDENKQGENRVGIVQTRSSRVLFLRMFAPLQDDLMNPDRNPAGVSCSVIGGFYEVIKVKSVFEGGKFTQTIEGAKIENLNYVENFVDLNSMRDRIEETPLSTNTEVPLRNSQPGQGG